MFSLNKFLAKLGYETNGYKIKRFKAAHPEHIVISTKLTSALVCDNRTFDDIWEEHHISDIVGEGVFFARSKRQLYVEVGKVEMDLFLEQYTIDKQSLFSRRWSIENNYTLQYRVVFDAVRDGEYRFRLNTDNHELQLIYERGEEHKVYTYNG